MVHCETKLTKMRFCTDPLMGLPWHPPARQSGKRLGSVVETLGKPCEEPLGKPCEETRWKPSQQKTLGKPREGFL